MADHSRSPKTDFYSILGITAASSIKEICKAYKSLVLKWSPDKNPFDQKEAQEKFAAINEAYDKVNIINLPTKIHAKKNKKIMQKSRACQQ